jgi:hypothetical protein
MDFVNVGAVRGSFVQTVANQLRFVQVLASMDKIVDTDYSLDLSKGMGYIGESLGGICGSILAALDNNLKSVILNVSGGGFATIMGGFLDSLVTEEYRLTATELKILLQMFMERVDPISYAGMILKETDRQVLMQNVVSDYTMTFSCVESMAAAIGIPMICPCPEETSVIKKLPVKNAPAESLGLFYYTNADHGFLLANHKHPEETDAARYQCEIFHGTYFKNGTAVIIDPGK